MVHVTTTGTTARHTALMDSATPIDPVIPHTPATIRTDCTVTVIATMKRRNAALRTTRTVRAFATDRLPKLQPLVQILADITT